MPEELKPQWWTCFEELETVPFIQIPRSYFPSGWSGAILHVFRDSSKKANGAVAYLRAKQESDVQTSIVMPKSKITPAYEVTDHASLETFGIISSGTIVPFYHGKTEA